MTKYDFEKDKARAEADNATRKPLEVEPIKDTPKTKKAAK